MGCAMAVVVVVWRGAPDGSCDGWRCLIEVSLELARRPSQELGPCTGRVESQDWCVISRAGQLTCWKNLFTKFFDSRQKSISELTLSFHQWSKIVQCGHRHVALPVFPRRADQKRPSTPPPRLLPSKLQSDKARQQNATSDVRHPYPQNLPSNTTIAPTPPPRPPRSPHPYPYPQT